jgi:hypothetical protein
MLLFTKLLYMLFQNIFKSKTDLQGQKVLHNTQQALARFCLKVKYSQKHIWAD